MCKLFLYNIKGSHPRMYIHVQYVFIKLAEFIQCVCSISEKTEITGCTNLVEFNGLEHTYNKFCNKKGKEELSSFLPHLPGYIDAPGIQDNR